MAQVTLAAVGTAIGGPVGGAIGSAIGRAVDRTALNSLSPARQVGRIGGIQLSDSAQGAPLKQVYGKARVAGTVIWAARLKEHRETTRASKNRTATQNYSYSLSFAVALCEGPIDGIGRIWADGQLLDRTGLNMRLYKGSDTQTPDVLIAAVEGGAPAYRGVAYVVFEDMDITPFGNRPPQLSFEVIRRAEGEHGDVESTITGVCMIPGAGEFVYATQPVSSLAGFTKVKWETQNNADGRTDFMVSLDQLEAALPNCKNVSLVVSWFGNSMEAATCFIQPGVEVTHKATKPVSWSVAGLERHQAYRVSQIDGKPAYGGTPSDSVVVDAIRELKRRGFKVTLIPFIMMDCPGYPWRGRITAATDGTSAVHAAVASFVGGVNDWGFRRFLRHCASLCVQAGGVDTFVLSSELRGLTWLNDGAGNYPFVQALRTLAAEVRALVGPSTKIGYGADWSEYRGHQTPDGFVFHLDPLWADVNSDFVGLDWYAPLTDWRDGAHLDSAYGSIRNPQYLSDRMRGGEGFDWYYASDSDRNAQVRTPIIDTAHGEHWIYRPKDVLNWWSNAHHDRPGGVRSVTPTAWVPKSKPIRFIEYGCGAVDKGPNAPNLFQDPKSVESLMPPYSTGARDDAVQAAYLKAFADFYAKPVNNPVSPVYGERMVAGMDVWCWDARPFPYFPQRSDIWGDTGNWRTGHWLNGRAGGGDVRNVVSGIMSLVGLAGEDLSLDEINGVIEGYVIERPMRVADALSPLLDVLGVEVAEQGKGLRLIASGRGVEGVITDMPREGRAPVFVRRDLMEVPGTLTLRCYDPDRDYQMLSVEVRHDAVRGAGRVDIDLPVVMRATQARDVAARMLNRLQSVRHAVTVEAEPLALLRFEAGDTVGFERGEYRLSVVDKDAQPAFTLIPAPGAVSWSEVMPDGGGEVLVPAVGTYVQMLDLPPLGGDANDRPVLIAASDPAGVVEVYAGAGAGSLTLRGTVSTAAGVGQLLDDLPVMGGERFVSAAHVDVRLEGMAPQATDMAGLRAGANILAVLSLNDEWELIQFREVTMLTEGQWRLSGLVRGQWGTAPARRAGAVEGAPCILLPPQPVRAAMALEERGLSRLWRAGPAGFGAAADRSVEATGVWHGLSLRPRAPVHGRVRTVSGGMAVSWIRSARYDGDGWEGEPPLGESTERYRLRFCQGSAVRRVVELTQPDYVYTQASADFPAGLNAGSVVRIAQRSEVYGWGIEAVVGLV